MSGAIRFIATAPQSQNPIIFFPIMNYSMPNNHESISKLNSFDVFNKHDRNQGSFYKTIQVPKNSPSWKYQSDSGPVQPTRRFRFDYSNNDKYSRSGSRIGQQSFNQRDGWHGAVGGGKHTPAISALALLGFLFFLNLIQNSLLNNRLLLINTTANGTVLGNNIAFGRSGRVRQRRGLGYNHYILTPDSIPTHPNRQLQTLLKKPDSSSRFKYPTWRRMEHNQSNPQIKTPISINKSWTSGSLINQLRKVSLECLKRLACNAGKSIFRETGPGGGIVMRFLGGRIMPISSRQSWVGGIFRAMSYGSTAQYRCDKVFRKCTIKNMLRVVG